MRYYDPENKALSSLFDLLSAIADGFPDKDFKAYSKKQRQGIINSLITFSDENAALLSSEMNDIIYPYPELSFEKLRGTLKFANKKYINSMKARRDEWIAFADRFDESTQNALVRFIDDRLIYDSIFLSSEQTNTAAFSTDYTNAYRQTLHLKNPIFNDNFNTEIFEITDAEIDVLDSGYRLSFLQTDKVVTVDFSDVRLETRLLNYSTVNMWDGSPWRQISDSLTVLRYKKDILGMAFLNEKEKAILPLCEFSPIHSINSQYQSVSGDKAADEMFIHFAKQIGNNRVAELTQQYANTYLKERKKAHKALIKELNKLESEALARMILYEIKGATAGYPTEAELDIAPEVLAKSRKTVTEILTQRGYEGEYPHFRKMSSLKGIKLLEMQGQPVIVGHEKNMACMIDCYENSINFNTLGMSYTVSTIFLKKDESYMIDLLDGYSGFFPYKHRRRARSLSSNLNFRDDGELTYDFKSSVIAAAKTAECEKLTKEERRNIASVGPGLYGGLIYGGLFLFTGLLFGLMFCPAIFLVCFLIGTPFVIFSSETTFSEFVRFLVFDLPWLWMFLFCVAGFGLPMTIATAIAKKRG